MTVPYQLHPAQPLAEETLVRHLTAPLIRADANASGEPSFAQSLTRLQHLRRQLFRAEDWDELAWLIAEGSHFETKRLHKHPLLKMGPRRRLQERVQHFHGRATIKTAALASAMEAPLRRLLIQSGHPLQPIKCPPPIAWNRFQINPATFGAPGPEHSAAILEEIAPTLLYLLDLVAPLDTEQTAIRNNWEHFHWHAREIAAQHERLATWTQTFARPRALNRLLRIALENAQTLLLHLREVHLLAASGVSREDLDGPL